MQRQYGYPGSGFPQGGQGGGGQQPSTQTQPPGPPPSFTPQAEPQAQGGAQVYAVDPGAIRGCLYRWTYIWLRGRQQFWFYPIFVGPRSIAGFRWSGRGWYYYGVDLRQITQFRCY
ncbi:hypothetical protein EV207_105155 [Scopulibacillus darangshiensis]|uniref:Transporter n=1 Tax=Scopulibacillus darangshiensis TaxID=442528 RepID=A0A4V2SNC7_9BACL|nr:hypothetical protein EV207_105155 [Scopulibacillus darangshiensis]